MQVFVNRNIVLMFSLSEKVEFFMIGLVCFVGNGGVGAQE